MRGILDGPNAKYTAPGGPIDFYWGPVTKVFTNTAEGEVITIAGDFQSQLGCEGASDGNWQPWCFGSLTSNSGEGIYQFTTTDVAAGSYEGKAAFDTGWDKTIGTPEGDNVKFTVSRDHSNLEFVVDTNKSTLCVYEDGVELFCPSETTPPVEPEENAMLTVTPASVAAGESVQASASRFGPDKEVRFVLVASASQGEGISIEVGRGYASEKGDLEKILGFGPDLAPGNYLLQARGADTGRSAEADLTVTSASTGPEKPQPAVAALTLDQQQVKAGSKVVASAAGFEAGERIVFSLDGEGGKPVLGTATATTGGSVIVTLTVPGDSKVGSYQVSAIGQTSERTATAVLKVVALAVTGAQVGGLAALSVALLAGGVLTIGAVSRGRAGRGQ